MTSKVCCGFNRQQPLLENLLVTLRLPFFPAKISPVRPKSNFFVMARSASVALGEVGQRNWFHVKGLFLLRLVPILVSHVSSVFFTSCFAFND